MTSNFFTLSFVAVFGSGIRDPGSGMGKNQDPGSGINIPDPPNWMFVRKSENIFIIYLIDFCRATFTTGGDEEEKTLFNEVTYLCTVR
jgi:hypothetical protein